MRDFVVEKTQPASKQVFKIHLNPESPFRLEKSSKDTHASQRANCQLMLRTECRHAEQADQRVPMASAAETIAPILNADATEHLSDDGGHSFVASCLR